MIGSIFTGVVAAIHIYIVILEMFLWESERGRKAFGLTAEFAKSTRVPTAARACGSNTSTARCAAAPAC